MTEIPQLRIRQINDAGPREDATFVLYWMTSARRGESNFGLQRAVDWAERLNKPLAVVETLVCGGRWDCDRFHRFAMEGMVDNANHFAERRTLYHPYLERQPGEIPDLLAELGKHACVIVCDDFPIREANDEMAGALRQTGALCELVDSNGLLPMRAAEKVFLRAFDFRRFLQKNLLPHLAEFPLEDALQGASLPQLHALPADICQRWPASGLGELHSCDDRLQSFSIDHHVGAVKAKGGAARARQVMDTFVQQTLGIYDSERNQPQQQATSGLSPYLHFGHISAHQVFDAITRMARWTPNKVAAKANGSSQGWWGADPNVESFLDELVTWRELGYNRCSKSADYDQFESLPEWAQATLNEHAGDKRQHVYSLAEFEQAETHDSLWNAAQRQLTREGVIHNYLRMLWGKKILEWSASPREALQAMIELNNKYALDGRNPNSYSGIFWVLGRYDRAWGPERQIFGKIRYMSSENTARKIRVKKYLERYSANEGFRQEAFISD